MSTAAVLVLAQGDALEDAMARIAGALRVPVFVLALVALLVIALELGRFATELWRRRRPGAAALGELAAIVFADPGRAAELAPWAPSAPAGAALRRLALARASGRPAAVERALAHFELAVQRRLDRTRLLVRAGPALGLMGTLIPLAPGLASLNTGNLAPLAADLRTAFAATVIGLLVGTVAFGLTLVRGRLYAEDLAALEEALELAGPPAAVPTAPVLPATPAPGSVAAPAAKPASTAAEAPGPAAQQPPAPASQGWP